MNEATVLLIIFSKNQCYFKLLKCFSKIIDDWTFWKFWKGAKSRLTGARMSQLFGYKLLMIFNAISLS
jgi:hypothetical protein